MAAIWSRVKNISFTTVNTFLFCFCIFQLCWGTLQLLFYLKILNTDYVSAIFSAFFSEKYHKLVSHFVLLACGFVLGFHLIFVRVLERRKRTLSVSSNVRKCFAVCFGLHAVIYILIVCLGLGIISGLEFSVRSSMFVLQRNGDTTTALDWMNMYQKLFRCCGAEDVVDWMEVANKRVPQSCCKRDIKMCDFERSKIEVFCDKKRNSTLDHCHFDTIELNRDGCENGIRAFMYSNISVIGVNVVLLIYILSAWLILSHSHPNESQITVVQSIQKQSISSLAPSNSVSKEIARKQHSSFSQGDQPHREDAKHTNGPFENGRRNGTVDESSQNNTWSTRDEFSNRTTRLPNATEDISLNSLSSIDW